MKNLRKRLFSAILTVAVILCFSAFLLPRQGHNIQSVSGLCADNAVFAAGETENITAVTVLPDEEDSAANVTVITAERLAAMLDLNYCYNKSFDSGDSMRGCAAMSLFEYASDFDGYGFCISSALVDAFVYDFYGEVLPPLPPSDSAPEGYVAVPECEPGTFCHIPVTLTETDDGYELVTRIECYFGGSDRDSHLVKSFFRKCDTSVFGVNLVFSEIL